MIVRDEESNLPHCLESVRGLFDEIVIVDTGSRDRTVEIARAFGAQVFDFIWVDDFAAARNAALAHATGDYAFWLDADDVIDPPNEQNSKSCWRELRPASWDRHRRPWPSQPPAASPVGLRPPLCLRPRTERRRRRYRRRSYPAFPGHRRRALDVQRSRADPARTHKSRRAAWSGRRSPCGIPDMPTGRCGPGSSTAIRRILRGELAERPDDPFTCSIWGSIAIERTEWNEALGYLTAQPGAVGPDGFDHPQAVCPDRDASTRCWVIPAPPSGRVPKGLRSIPKMPSCGSARRSLHRHAAASRPRPKNAWRRILTLRRPEKFASMDQGIYGHVTRRNLAALAMERGRCGGGPAPVARGAGRVPRRQGGAQASDVAGTLRVP